MAVDSSDDILMEPLILYFKFDFTIFHSYFAEVDYKGVLSLYVPSGRAPLVPLLGTPDSRVTSIDTGTSKSFATIPEDDENAHSPSDNDRPDADLISIDRVRS